MVNEARLERVASGLAPVTPGWFVVNTAEAAWVTNDDSATYCRPVTHADLLPRAFRQINRMEREIALPYPAIIAAIDALEDQGVLLLGWEPCSGA